MVKDYDKMSHRGLPTINPTIKKNVPFPTRLLTTFILCAIFLLIPTYYFVTSDDPGAMIWASDEMKLGGGASGIKLLMQEKDELADEAIDQLQGHLHGKVIMGKLENATAKAELGRASWKLLHTMAARFPMKPDEEEKQAFKSFLYLFSRLYPCGECAAEFQALLLKFPPQTSSRDAAAIHLCHLHNQVNLRLKKPMYDCSKGLLENYDCGCADDDHDGFALKGKGKKDFTTGKKLING